MTPPARSPDLAIDRALALDRALAVTRYQSYVYGYPHKTAYRPIDPPRMTSLSPASEAASRRS